MLGFGDLKYNVAKAVDWVECPVKDCKAKVKRQRKVFKREEKFRCPKHNIYISPTTFEYYKEVDNILWKEAADLLLLDRIKSVKRENRIARDNSEDAVIWNVFRYLEKHNLISQFLSHIFNTPIVSREVIYWSYSRKEDSSWSELNRARNEFGEDILRSSEPDIIIKTNSTLFFIEAKLTATNQTKPRQEYNYKNYLIGGDSWFSKIFKSSYKLIAKTEMKYELMRSWLLGTWMAAQTGLNFFLINLVLSEREKEIESIFRTHIKENPRMKFIRMTWEDIYRQILTNSLQKDRSTMINYFEKKTIGYDENGELQKAFSV